MAAILVVAVLALVGQVTAQAENDSGRGFPDCVNGPLKNNTVCDQSAGKSLYVKDTVYRLTRHRSTGKGNCFDQSIHPSREDQQYWQYKPWCSKTWSASLHMVAGRPSWSGNLPGCHLQCLWQLQLRNFFPAANLDGSCLR